MICRICGYDNPAGATVCLGCGHRLDPGISQGMNCPRCGELNPAGGTNCEGCAWDLEPVDRAPSLAAYTGDQTYCYDDGQFKVRSEVKRNVV
jgi:ribosomal protein L40E